MCALILQLCRIWAVAAVADRSMFGMGEGSVVASLPLVVRLTGPRFLNYGDKAQVAVVLQNLRSVPLQVKYGGVLGIHLRLSHPL